MINALLICTGLYILIALVLTGVENYSNFKGVNDPLAFVFEKMAPWLETVISISAVVATSSVLLVFQLGQPRIWMSMSRDGLLPKQFQRIHPKFQTPSYATIVTGLLVGIPSLFLQDVLVTDLTSIGTLFAFALVAGGVLLLPKIAKEPGKFQLPYVNGQVLIPLITAVFIFVFRQRVQSAFVNIANENHQEILFLLFILLAVIMSILTVTRKYSAIPVLGVLFCSYLLIEIPVKSWFVFFGWMAFGLLIYFLYGYRKSKLAVKQ
jgi:APA family basic amino acid/polyamine antiporter